MMQQRPMFSSSSTPAAAAAWGPSVPPSSAGGISEGKWVPRSGAPKELFDLNNMATLVIILVLATLAYALLRYLHILYLHRPLLLPTSHNPTPPNPNVNPHTNKAESPHDDDIHSNNYSALPTLVFSPAARARLAGGDQGAAAECAICLSDFVQGDRLRLMPACNHGFHAKCVEEWLVSNSSCPTCRTTTRRPATSMAEP